MKHCYMMGDFVIKVPLSNYRAVEDKRDYKSYTFYRYVC